MKTNAGEKLVRYVKHIEVNIFNPGKTWVKSHCDA